MAAYQYTALDNTGKTKKGTLQADTEKSVRHQLRLQGLTPLSIGIVSEASLARSQKFSLFASKISVGEVALITRQLATMLSAGIPLEETLLSVAEQSDKSRVKSILLAVRSKVLEGHTLASGLGEFPKVFDTLYRATVAAGEKTGHLETVLERLAEFTERRQEVQQKISQALIYPSIIIAAAMGIVSFLLMFVVPKMVSVFEQSGQILPGPTRLLLAISSGIQNFGLYFMLLLVIGIVIFVRMLKRTEFKTKVDVALLRWPLWGKSLRLVNTARFAHTLAILTAAGVDVIEAMRIASEVVGNIPIRKSLELATKQVREGVTVHRALKETTYFPPMSVYLIASGENSGQLENMLERAASAQEKQVTRLIDVILALFEPVMVLVMGGIVLFIVLAILLPIFDLNQFVQ